MIYSNIKELINKINNISHKVIVIDYKRENDRIVLTLSNGIKLNLLYPE